MRYVRSERGLNGVDPVTKLLLCELVPQTTPYVSPVLDMQPSCA
jgi:hypothetical protein